MAKAKKATAKTNEAPADEPAWVDAGDGYQLALEGAKLVCKNPKGARLSSVPKNVKSGEVAEQLAALKDWLAQHDRECIQEVETWMLRSLPVPCAALRAVWDDPSWRAPLENTVVCALGPKDDVIAEGFFRGADRERGIGLVDLDGETRWIDAHRARVPHPVLIEELTDYRELATELGVTQAIAQLFRETFARGKDVDPKATGIGDFAFGKFQMLVHALGKAKTLGYRVRGGYAVCPVWEAGVVIEARYWIGADDPQGETYTGDLCWVDARENLLPLGDVTRVAWSEGMRMASSIYAARVVEKKEEA
jgi:hypothetical protein